MTYKFYFKLCSISHGFQVIAIPARDVTSVSWGGPDLDILYVTTSRFSLKENERKQFPSAGSVFAVKYLNAKGLPPYTADVVDSIEKKLVSIIITNPVTSFCCLPLKKKFNDTNQYQT